MTELTETLCVEMPRLARDPEVEHAWGILATHLQCRVEFSYSDQDTGEYRVRRQGDTAALSIARHDAERRAGGMYARPVENGQRQYQVLVPGGDPRVRREGAETLVAADLVSSLMWLLRLQEEREVPLRDQFGLVEAKNSPRFAGGGLSLPLVENLAEWIGAVLGIPRKPAFPHGAEWAVAVTCDIDVLENDHLPGVIGFLERHGVRRPTFLVCAVGEQERTIRDPHYDICDAAIQARLRPLQEADVEVGLHGSYLAHDRLSWLRSQKQRLEDCLGRRVDGHRSHFLRYAYPRSWAWQYRAGLRYDMSLGYPDFPGLRNGSASPLLFLDPERGQVPFVILSTVLLDQHFFWPETWDAQDVQTYLEKLLEDVAAAHGVLVVDWHTYTLRNPMFPGWWDHLDRLLALARQSGAYLAGSGVIVEEHLKRMECAHAATC